MSNATLCPVIGLTGNKVEEDMEKVTATCIVGWIVPLQLFMKDIELHDMIGTKRPNRLKESSVGTPQTLLETISVWIKNLPDANVSISSKSAL